MKRQAGLLVEQEEKRKKPQSEEASIQGLKTRIKDESEKSIEDKDNSRSESIKRVLKFLRPKI